MILTDRSRSDRHRREKMLREKKGRDTRPETHKTAQHEVFLAFVFPHVCLDTHISKQMYSRWAEGTRFKYS